MLVFGENLWRAEVWKLNGIFYLKGKFLLTESSKFFFSIFFEKISFCFNDTKNSLIQPQQENVPTRKHEGLSFLPLHLWVCETQLALSPKVLHVLLTRHIRNTLGSWNARTWPRKPSNTLLVAADTPWDCEQPGLARAWATYCPYNTSCWCWSAGRARTPCHETSCFPVWSAMST